LVRELPLRGRRLLAPSVGLVAPALDVLARLGEQLPDVT
jgi:hypothetical protein